MKDYKFTINGNTYNVSLKSLEDNVAELEVNGTQYSVELHKEVKASKTPKLVRAKTPKPTSAPNPLSKKASLSQVKAPLPGNILEIMVREGDEVKKEQVLMVMEAMKMENKVLAELSGKVKSIKVTVGESVLQGQVLIEIE